MTRWGTVKIDWQTMMTPMDGVFAAGDIVRGASLVVWGVRDGQDAAEQIDRWINAAVDARALRQQGAKAMTQSFDAQAYLAQRAHNEDQLTALVCMVRTWNTMPAVWDLSRRVMASQTGPLSSPPLKPCKLFGIAVRLTLTA